MRRHGNEASPSILHTSSIALLQERFRNLQRVKEMREGRDLQRVYSTDTDHAGSLSTPNSRAAEVCLTPPYISNEQPMWFLHPDLVRPSRPLHGPVYHGLDANGAKTSPPPASSWGGMQNSGYRSDVDVDTSLHL
ncbi:uncharacterized protein LOC133914455 [Phragmites australis]|uniref:uncharacterized protein LOC133914455 n=1 Tax=Phragmites australis TaxID=29695 RepID=UPI002D797DE8|nr:uncharacterized protein LOC133914455 [Phragmites australis]